MAGLMRSPAVRLTSVAFFLFLSLLLVGGTHGYQGRKVGGWMDVKDVKENEEVQKLGKFSVEEYNRNIRESGHLSNGSGELEFLEVVAAKRQVVSGIKYDLKVSATSATTIGETKMFDSVVVVKPWTHSKQLIEFSPRSDALQSVFGGVGGPVFEKN